jgi:DNA-binding GntR family transcriptional regulator
MTIDEIAELIYRTLCRHRRAHGASSDMSLDELATALGLPRRQVREAVMVARLSDDLLIAFVTPARDRVRLGRSWLRRCESETDTSETT